MIKKEYKKNSCKVTFTVAADHFPAKSDIRVLGDFNNWNWDEGLKLSKKKEEYSASIELETGRNYQFKYLQNGENWFNDTQADGFAPSPFGVDNSVIVAESQAQPNAEKVEKAEKPKKTTTKTTKSTAGTTTAKTKTAKK